MTATLNKPASPNRRLYGDDLVANFGVEAPAPAMVTTSLPHTELAVTELRVDEPAGRISERFGGADAYMVAHELRSYRGLEFWENGRHVDTYDMRAGDTSFSDLRNELQVKFDVPVHVMLWVVPRAALNLLAEEANVPPIDGLPHGPGRGFVDETMRHLNLTAVAALRRPGQVSRLFVDYLTLAFVAHVAQTYGGMEPSVRLIKGGLAPWQERRAKEMLVADMTGRTPLAEIALACGVSSGHFARAFRISTGQAPHAWLLSARVEHAMTLLRQPALSLSEVALACGFSDNSHFIRVFTRRTGQTPGVWRRLAIR